MTMTQPPGFIDQGAFNPNQIPANMSGAGEQTHTEDDLAKMVEDWFVNQSDDQGAGRAASQSLPPSPGVTVPPTPGDGGPEIPPQFQPVTQGQIPPLPPVTPDVDDAAQGYRYEAPDPLAAYTREQREALAGFAQWVAEHPDQAEYVDAIMTGRFNPAQLQQPQPQFQQQQGFSQQAPADPRNPQGQQGLILPQSVQADLDAVKTVTRALWQQNQEAQRQVARSAYDQTVEQFAIANRLSKEQMEHLIQTTSQSGMVRVLAQSHSPGDAVRKAFDYHYATDPQFVQHRATMEQARNADQQRRAQKQAALAGSGGNTTTRSPVGHAQPTGDRITEQSRIHNMAAFIRQAQGQ